MACVQWMCEAGVDSQGATADGRTPLHCACAVGNLSVAKYLVEEHGVDKNKTDEGGKRPIDWAAEAGHLAVVELIVTPMRIR